MLLLLFRDSVLANFGSSPNFGICLAFVSPSPRCWLAFAPPLPRCWLALPRSWLAFGLLCLAVPSLLPRFVCSRCVLCVSYLSCLCRCIASAAAVAPIPPASYHALAWRYGKIRRPLWGLRADMCLRTVDMWTVLSKACLASGLFRSPWDCPQVLSPSGLQIWGAKSAGITLTSLCSQLPRPSESSNWL